MEREHRFRCSAPGRIFHSVRPPCYRFKLTRMQRWKSVVLQMIRGRMKQVFNASFSQFELSNFFISELGLKCVAIEVLMPSLGK